MPSVRTKGYCRYCHAAYTKAGMTKHLQACAERRRILDAPRPATAQRGRLYHILERFAE